MKKRLVIVDDSPFIRRVITDWVRSDPAFELVATGENGHDAVRLAQELRPDVMTLDIEMPQRDGLSALEEIMRVSPVPVVMVSSLTTQGAQATLKALDRGAVDFVAKPGGSASIKFLGARDELLAKLHAATEARLVPAVRKVVTPPPAMRPPAGASDRVLTIAASTGGPRALTTVWQGLPKGLPVPVLVVQHMPAGFTESFAKRLDSMGTVACKEAKTGDRLTPGLALLAPGGLHMVVERGGTIRLTDGPAVHGVRPAADPLFMTLAALYGSRVVGAILTGMGRDGAEGARLIRRAGGTMLGESESTCTIYGMPRAAKEADGTDGEVPIHEMAHALVASLAGRAARAS